MKIKQSKLIEIIEQSIDALDEVLEEEEICESCPDLEEAFTIADEGGPMKKEGKEEITEFFGFGKDKPVVDCDELYEKYVRIMRSSAGGNQSSQLHQLRKAIKKNCPDMYGGRGKHPRKRRE